MARHKATFTSAYASVVEARELVKQFATGVGFSEVDIFDIGLAAGEACSNAVLHAATEHGFWLTLDYNEGVFTVEVHDFGPGFSLEGRGSYIEPHFRKSGGLGIYIMRVLMDEVTYEMNDDGTTVRLVKHANEGSRAEDVKKASC